MEIDLLSFAPFFEIIGGLNFAYAGSESFRAGLNQDVLNIQSTLAAAKKKLDKYKVKFDEIGSFITVSAAEKYKDDTAHRITSSWNNILDKHLSLENNCTKLKDSEIEERDFSIGFKSMFLISGIFCLILLLLLGYAQFYNNNETNLLTFVNCIKWLSAMLIANLWIFGRSFIKKYNNKEIKTTYILLLFFAFILIGFKTNINQFDFILISSGRSKITLAVLLALSPYLFHLMRIFFHKLKYRFKMYLMLYSFYLYVRITLNELIIKKNAAEQYDIGVTKTIMGALKHFYDEIKYIYLYKLHAVITTLSGGYD
jgi:hypothetical protein